VATETITDVLHDLAAHGYIEYPPEPDFSTDRLAVRRAQRYAESVDDRHWAFMATLRARKRVAVAQKWDKVKLTGFGLLETGQNT